MSRCNFSRAEIEYEVIMTYFFQCDWTNGKGGFNPDYEGCDHKSQPFNSLEECLEAAKGHEHDYKGWGQVPDGWQYSRTRIYSLRKNGKKEKFLGITRDILKSHPKKLTAK